MQWPKCFSLEKPELETTRELFKKRKGVQLLTSFKRHDWRDDNTCRRCEKEKNVVSSVA